MSGNNVSGESLLQLFLILLGGAALGAVAFLILLVLTQFITTPLFFYLFGTRDIVDGYYIVNQSGFANVISYWPIPVLLLLAVMFLATGEAVAIILGLIACIGGAIGMVVGVLTFADQKTVSSYKLEDLTIQAIGTGQIVQARAYFNRLSSEYQQERVAKEILSKAAKDASYAQNMLPGVPDDIANVKCAYHFRTWSNVDPKSFAVFEKYGARIFSDGTQFRRNCPQRMFDERQQLTAGINGYVQYHFDTATSQVLKAFWRRGIFAQERFLDEALEDAKGDLRRAINNRDADLEEDMRWIVKVLEYLVKNPEQNQRNLLKQWG